MKASELRIGNLIKCSERGEIFVRGIINDNVIIDDFSRIGSVIEPITLTEEWIIKFGFVKTEFDFYQLILKDKYKIYLSINFDLESCEICQANYGFTVICKYVHQLQNLYFALTGEELTIKD